MFDDNPCIRHHEAVAENYGRTILAWLNDQPKDCLCDIADARRELGLDPIQFEMGMNWCRREGYLGLFNLDLPRPRPKLRSTDRPLSPLAMEQRREFVRRMMEDLDDDVDEEDDDALSSFYRRRGPSGDSGRSYRRFSEYKLEQKFFDRELKVAALALLSSAIITWLVVNQFKGLTDADRSALAATVFVGFALSMFAAVVFVTFRPHASRKD